MKELTDEEKMELYLRPIVDSETQINNKIKGYSRFIEETEIFLDTIKDISQQDFTDKYLIEFHHRVISKKYLIIDIYNILLVDWKNELDSAKKELSLLKGVQPSESVEDKLNEVHSELVDPNPDDINAEFPVKKKGKFLSFLEKFFSYADKTVAILKDTNVIKDKK